MEENQKNKFNIPEGYFENFNEKLFTRLEAEGGEPNTDFLPKSDGFGLSEGYMDTVHFNVLEKIGQSPTKVVSIWRNRSIYYAAATIAAIFTLTFVWNYDRVNNLDFDDLASADIEAYMENNDLSFSSYELVEDGYLGSITLEDITTEELGEETILDYLNENVDILNDLELDYEN